MRPNVVYTGRGMRSALRFAPLLPDPGHDRRGFGVGFIGGLVDLHNVVFLTLALVHAQSSAALVVINKIILGNLYNRFWHCQDQKERDKLLSNLSIPH